MVPPIPVQFPAPESDTKVLTKRVFSFRPHQIGPFRNIYPVGGKANDNTCNIHQMCVISSCSYIMLQKHIYAGAVHMECRVEPSWPWARHPCSHEWITQRLSCDLCVLAVQLIQAKFTTVPEQWCDVSLCRKSNVPRLFLIHDTVESKVQMVWTSWCNKWMSPSICCNCSTSIHI